MSKQEVTIRERLVRVEIGLTTNTESIANLSKGVAEIAKQVDGLKLNGHTKDFHFMLDHSGDIVAMATDWPTVKEPLLQIIQEHKDLKAEKKQRDKDRDARRRWYNRFKPFILIIGGALMTGIANWWVGIHQTVTVWHP